MKIKELIILAGGLGTRLRSAVPELPKCMAPVHGIPFIDYVVDHFLSQGVERIIFALGYQSEILQEHLENKYSDLDIAFSVENYPLGTGGAIQLAAKQAIHENVLVTNGDTLFKADLSQLSQIHEDKKSTCTLVLKPMAQFDRFGVVEVDEHHAISSFKEKQYYNEGLINGGIYALHIPSLVEKGLGESFSFEKDYLEQFVTDKKMYASIQDAYFIDMGIPEDYKRAAEELRCKG